MASVNMIPETTPHRVTEMQVGDTIFTVISVESNCAKERLYDKVKRLIMDGEATRLPDLPSAA